MEYFIAVALTAFGLIVGVLIGGSFYYAKQMIKVLREGKQVLQQAEEAAQGYTTYMKALQGKDVK